MELSAERAVDRAATAGTFPPMEKTAFLSVLVFLPALLGSAAEIYYVNQPELMAGQINVMKPDGTGLANVWTASQVTDLRGIAVDGASSTLFFHHANQHATTLATTEVSLRKMATSGGVQTVIAAIADNTFAGDVEFDPIEGWVYSAVTGALELRRCRADGSLPGVVLTHTAAGQGPYFFSVDAVNQFAYWGIGTVPNQTNTAFARGSLAGVVDATFSLITPSRTRDIEIDATVAGGRLYWCDRQNGAVYSRAVAGGTVTTVASGMNAPHGLALDIEAGKGYVADTGKRGSGTQPSRRRVSRFNLDGSGVLEPLSPFDAVAEPWDVAIDKTTRNYADWKTRYFSTTSPLTLPADDADGDGATNAAEYAFFTHPGRANTTLPSMMVQDGGVRYLRRTTTDLDYRVEVSTDLVVWHWNGDTPGAVWTMDTATDMRDSDSQWKTVIPASALPGPPKLYYRLRATLP